jgi:hypothetical protein
LQLQRLTLSSVLRCLFVCVFVCLCVCLFVCLFVCCLFVVCLLFVCLFGLLVCLFACLFVCLFVCLSLCDGPLQNTPLMARPGPTPQARRCVVMAYSRLAAQECVRALVRRRQPRQAVAAQAHCTRAYA